MDTKMKSVLGSVLVIGIVAAMMTAGTQSWYSDTETSVGNTFTAGTLDLQVWNSSDDTWVDDPNVPNVNYLWNEMVNNLAPGDSGTITIPVRNNGSIAGVADIHFKVVHNYENGLTEPEADDGDTGGDPGDGEGELCASIHVNVSYNGNKIIDDKTLEELNCTDYDLGDLPAGESRNIVIDVWIPSTVGNEIQSDSCVVDIEFSLDQATD